MVSGGMISTGAAPAFQPSFDPSPGLGGSSGLGRGSLSALHPRHDRRSVPSVQPIMIAGGVVVFEAEDPAKVAGTTPGRWVGRRILSPSATATAAEDKRRPETVAVEERTVSERSIHAVVWSFEVVSLLLLTVSFKRFPPELC